MIASLVTALFLSGFASAGEAATFLYIYGAMLLAAELVIVSFGTLALSGALALYVGYAIQTGDNLVFGVPIDWPLIFGIAFIEALAIAISVSFILRNRRLKVTTGKESMIGQKATVVEWDGAKGSVIIQGEPWKAFSDKALQLDKDSEVTVEAVEGLKVRISA